MREQKGFNVVQLWLSNIEHSTKVFLFTTSRSVILIFADNAQPSRKSLFRPQCHLKQVNISQYDIRYETRESEDIQFESRFIDSTIQQQKFNLGTIEEREK